MRIYKFSYDSKAKRAVMNFCHAFCNFLFAILVFLLIILFSSDLNLYFYPWYSIYYYVVLILSLITGITSAIICLKGFKGIAIKDDFIKFYRKYISLRYFSKTYRSVKFDEIMDCQIVSRYTISKDEKRFCWIGGTGKEYIKIILNNGKPYFFAVENQENVYHEFLNKINKKNIQSDSQC